MRRFSKILLSISTGALMLSIAAMPVLAQAGEEHGGGGTVEILFDILILTVIVIGVLFGLGAFGGAVGGGLKFVYSGLIVFGVNYFLTALHHFNINLFAALGETIHTLTHHGLTLIAFTLVAVGFYKIRQVARG